MLIKNRVSHINDFDNFNFSVFFNVPKSIFFILLSICSFSIACLYSANASFFPWAIKQMFYILFSFILFFFIVCTNTKIIFRYTKHFFIISIILLVIATFFGRKTLGASRWIDLGIIKVQPSELIKITIVLMTAKFFSLEVSNKIVSFFTLLKISTIVAPVFIIIFLQPDLATSVIILAVIIMMFFSIGLQRKYMIFIFLFGLIACPIIWFNFLKGYQKLRVINFLFPENDPFGSGYNIIQSKIAIGSGELFGKGFLSGTQGRLKFLPEHHTDFIFTSVCEEFGFIGSMIVIMLYSYLIFYGLKVVDRTPSTFGKLVCIGCSSLFFFHIFINIGMVCGLLPVAGIPLIMFSYGGSSLLLGVICIALIVNIDIHRRLL